MCCAGGENGFNQAIELSAGALANVKFVQVILLWCWSTAAVAVWRRCSACAHPLRHGWQLKQVATVVQEKRLISKFFDEISQDSGKHTSGVKVTRDPEFKSPAQQGWFGTAVS